MVKSRAIRFFTDNINCSSIVVDHWSHGGTNFIGIIGRTFKNGSLKEYLIALESADVDKRSIGIYQNVTSVLGIENSNCFIPVITDNTASMVKAFNPNESFNDCFYKIFCIEHVLAKIDDRMHKLEIFKDIDSCISAVDSYFNRRHEKFGLEVKPLTSRSTTRPWRSYMQAYEITLRNYDVYLQISKTHADLPKLPDFQTLSTLSRFQNQYCERFNDLEKIDADFKTSILVFFKLYELTIDESIPDQIRFALKIEIDKLKSIIFNDITAIFIFLSRMDFKGNFQVI